MKLDFFYLCGAERLKMEIFYSKDIDGELCRLGADESGHCIKVLRHKTGDEIFVIDGGNPYALPCYR